ncbi:hypothetical protein AAZV13_07G231900 [Glycine max]
MVCPELRDCIYVEEVHQRQGFADTRKLSPLASFNVKERINNIFLSNVTHKKKDSVFWVEREIEGKKNRSIGWSSRTRTGVFKACQFYWPGFNHQRDNSSFFRSKRKERKYQANKSTCVASFHGFLLSFYMIR